MFEACSLRPYVMFVLLDSVYLSAFLVFFIILTFFLPKRRFTKGSHNSFDSCCNKKHMNDQSLLSNHTLFIDYAMILCLACVRDEVNAVESLVLSSQSSQAVQSR